MMTSRCGNAFHITGLLSLQWRHTDHDSVSNHQPHGCLLNRLFRRRSKETSKLRVTGLCEGNSPGPVNSPHKDQLRGNVSIWWRHHVREIHRHRRISLTKVMLWFGVFFVLNPNKLLNKQFICWWFETPRYSCDVTLMTKPMVTEIYTKNTRRWFVFAYWPGVHPCN